MTAKDKQGSVDLGTLQGQFQYWEKTREMIDQLIDLILNYRQSGHPGGSRSKAHILLSLMLCGVMRWDIRDPKKTFADRFILSAGHTIPLVYCTLAVLNEAFHIKFEETGDEKYRIKGGESRILSWQDLLDFRHKGGLSGHAEMVEKTLFIKFNTGPSGHGGPAAAGEALALKRAGAGDVKVFFLEGEAGLTPGAVHETMNSAWGLNLDNLILLVDWNDYGIDNHAVSKVVYGTPEDWIGSHGWHITGTDKGSDWANVTETLLRLQTMEADDQKPQAAWFKTRKGRGYLKFDNFSHGSPHQKNSDLFWKTKKPFAEKYGVTFQNFGGKAPVNPQAERAEFEANLKAVMDVLRDDPDLVNYLTETLCRIGDSVPQTMPDLKLSPSKPLPFDDPRLYDFESYPDNLYEKPGATAANRAALKKWGAWVNAFGAKAYGRPLFLVSSADLAGSTNISGFADAYGEFEGYGWYALEGNTEGVLLPQEITEFSNAGIMVGLAAVNFAQDPSQAFDGFWGATSTYGSFSYLMYGMLRLYSQMAQDNPLKMGKVLWVAGHSGPETADDSRTHFGIFSPGVTQLFPDGHVINLHPWEHNEVPVMLGAALQFDVPIVALHLTRPGIEIPDRKALGMPSHFAAAKGAYVVRDYQAKLQKMGTLIVQGTSAMANIVKLLPNLNNNDINVKIVYAGSPELFRRQPEAYQEQVLTPEDRETSMVVTTQAKANMKDWMFNPAYESFALSADWDHRWRTGGTLEEVIEEAHLSPAWILKGIKSFVESQK